MTLSFKEVYTRFWECEEKSGVAALTEAGVPLWDIIRYDVCLEHLLVRAGLVTVPYRIPQKKSVPARVAHLARRVRLNRRVNLKTFQDGLLVLGNGRRKWGEDGKWHDALWDPLGAAVPAPALYLQMPAEERIWDPVPTPHLFYLDSVFVRALFEPGPKPVLSSRTIEVLTAFEHMLEEATGASLDVVPIAEAFLSRHVNRARAFGRCGRAAAATRSTLHLDRGAGECLVPRFS